MKSAAELLNCTQGLQILGCPPQFTSSGEVPCPGPGWRLGLVGQCPFSGQGGGVGQGGWVGTLFWSWLGEGQGCVIVLARGWGSAGVRWVPCPGLGLGGILRWVALTGFTCMTSTALC